MNLKEKSREITESLKLLKSELMEQRKETFESIENTREDIKVASAMGDRSENAAFADAVQKLQQLQTTMGNIEQRLKSMESAENEDVEYVPMNMIVMHSTFLLRDNRGEEFIFKMYPDDVFDIDRNILAKNSPIGKLLWLKEVGDVVSLDHRITGETIDYTIVEIY